MVSKKRKLLTRRRRHQLSNFHQRANKPKRSVHHRLRILKKRWLTLRHRSFCWVMVAQPLAAADVEQDE
jgi:hypothetical protein